LILDNESSQDLTTFFRQSSPPIQFQHVPPQNHRTNKAERAVRTAKNHFLSVLSAAHISFPPDRWHLLLPITELTLNHLRSFALPPLRSAWQGLHGRILDFQAHPIHPPGQLVVVHDSPETRASWAHHGKRAFYLSPSLLHYRCHSVFVPATSAVRISDTLSHFPEPLFPFEAPPRGLPPPDPTADRPSPQFDGLDLLGRQFIDPELGACTVIGAGTPVFLQPRTGNLGPDPLLPSGWHPTLRYQTVANRIESSSVTEIARWVV
jgi:hypothetical protein